MSKVIGRSEELQRQFLGLTVNGFWRGISFECLLKNAFDSAHIQEFEAQCPFTGMVDALGPVAFGQTQQLLGLAQAGPRELPLKEFLRKSAGVLSEFLSLLAIEVGPPPGEWRSLVRIIGVVGGMFAGHLPRMCFDELATVVDAHQRPIPTDIHPAANPTRRQRVERLLETDVMVRMHFTLRPLRRVEPRHTPWNQDRPFLLLKDLDRYRSRGSMDASSGHIVAPALGTAPDLLHVDERLPLPDAFARVSHGVFDNRFIFGVTWPCRIGQEPTVLGVLQKRFVQARRVSIRGFDGGFEVVDHNPPRTTPEKLKRPFETIDDRLQIGAPSPTIFRTRTTSARTDIGRHTTTRCLHGRVVRESLSVTARRPLTTSVSAAGGVEDTARPRWTRTAHPAVRSLSE